MSATPVLANDVTSTTAAYLDYLSAVRNLSPATIEAYRRDLGDFADFVGGERTPAEITLQDIRRYVRNLSESGRATSSINRRLSAVKGYFRFMEKTGTLNGNPTLAVRSLKAPKRLPEVMFEREVKAVLDFPVTTFGDLRDMALLETLYSSGARIAELCSANVEHLAIRKNTLLVRGKGSKERHVFLGKEAADRMKEYVIRRTAFLRERGRHDERALFLNLHGGRLTTRGAAMIIEKRTADAGIDRAVSPHTFRHSFATHVLDHGADIRVVQEFLGHSQLSTTQVYTHVGLDRLKRVYANAHPHARVSDRDKENEDE